MTIKKLLIIFIVNCIYQTLADLGDTCETPNGEYATCVSIYDCPLLLDAVKSRDPTKRDFLSKSQCGFERYPLVCCGTSSNFDDTDDQFIRGPVITNPNRGSNNNLLPNRDSCGYQKTEKIYGGNVTALDEYPWMALLQYRRRDRSLTFACGGSLISQRYVLTAAHCVTGQILNIVGPLVAVRLGEYDIRSDIDCTEVEGFQDCNLPPQTLGIQESIAHSGYNVNSRDRTNDIALVRLDKDVRFNDFIKPICLPLANEEARVGESLSVAGWGRTERGTSSAIKLKVSVPIKPFSNCANTYRNAGVILSDSQLCAGGENGKDSCTGDSGGPLMHYSSNDPNQFIVEGVVSFGPECGRKGFPAVYTKVNKYLDWINSRIRP